MAKRGKESIWNDAIERKNEEATKLREASDFLSVPKPIEKEKATLVNEKETKVEKVIEEKVVEKEVLKYTSRKPFKNESGRQSVNTHDGVIELENQGPHNSRKKWSVFGVLFSSILGAIILIPLVILAAGAALVVDSLLTMQELIGYRVNETEFAIKHEESGTYIQNPTYEGEQLILGEDKVNTFMFVDDAYYAPTTSDKKAVPNYDNLWLKSNMIFNGQEMVVSYEDGKVVWTGADNDSTIHLNKAKDGSNKFSVSLSNESAFVSKDKDSNRIVVSKDPDWFSFETNVEFITTTNEYIEDYTLINEGLSAFNPDLKLGVEGNAITLYSNKTGLCINSYKEVEHGEFPFFLTERDEYEDSLYLSDETDTNLFIQSNDLGEMALSSYQTLPFDRYATSEWQKYYPVITADADGTVKLQSFDLSQYTEVSLGSSDIPNAQFWLLPNPNNLREKAIYFPFANMFLTTENGSIGLQEISSEEEIGTLDFFTITHSPNANQEYTEIGKAVYPSGVKRGVVEIVDNPEVIDGYEFYGFGYESIFELNTDPTNFYTSVKDKTNCTKRRSVIKLKDLEERTTYHGVVATYRNKDSGIGKHVTFTYVPPFTTGDKGIDWPDGWPNINLPNINWPDINWPTLPIIDPGDPIIDGGNGDASTAKIWDSTDEVNTGTGDDIPVEEMLTAAATEIEVSVEVTQGTQDGVTKDVGVRLQETDELGNVIVSGYDQTLKLGRRPTDGETYSFIFEGLEPETDYLATVVFYDGHTAFEQVQSTPLELDSGETQMLATSERVVPTFVEGESSVTFDETGAGLSVYTLGNNFKPTDEIMIRIENERNGAVDTTGWIKVSEWGTVSVPNWTFSHNVKPNGEYYEATCTTAISLDTYDVNMWVRMDTSTDFVGWDEDCPAFDENYETITSDSSFDVIEILNMVGITAGKQHIIK